MARPIVIVGSINMDLVVCVAHVPAPGETILGRDFQMLPGGKGANQAVAVAQMGGGAVMVGRVGDDDLGRRLLAGLRERGVDATHVQATPGVASGIAMITVGDDAENAIAVASGANFAVTAEDVDRATDVLKTAAACLVQLELPVETIVHTAELCRRLGVPVIVDPAPAPQEALPEALQRADILSPNETEAAALTGLAVTADPKAVARALRERGARQVVLKLGARGAFVSTADTEALVGGFAVDAVDTTAAGDSFTGALAVALAEGKSLAEAARFANAAGALACTKLGAQSAVPTRAEVDRLVRGG